MLHHMISIVYVTCSPGPLEKAWSTLSELPAHGTRYPDDQWAAPEAQGLAPMDWLAPPHSSRVEQQQPTPHNYTEKIDSRDDFANANARPIMSSGSSDEINDNEWTGTLNLNGTRVPVRALMAEAVGDPYVCFRQMRISLRSICMQKIIGFSRRIGS
jgi:hypothetical protein